MRAGRFARVVEVGTSVRGIGTLKLSPGQKTRTPKEARQNTKITRSRSINMSRTQRKPYTKAKAFDASCRCHGGCPYCLRNRMHKYKKAELGAKQKEKDHYED